MGSDASFEGQEPFGGAAPRCVVCGVGLNRLEASAGKTCRNISCLTILAIRARDQAQRERQADVAAAAAWFSERGEETERVGVVPVFDRPLKPADPERQQEFRERLSAAMARAVDLVAEAPEPPGEMLNPGMTRTLGWACAMCQGLCCNRGGETYAFLSPDELAIQLKASPELSPEELLADYFAALPELSMEKSCVYHGEQGCVLPRSRRARLCNSYFCNGIYEWAPTMDPEGSVRAGVAAVDKGVVRRAVIIEEGVAVEDAP